MPNPVTSPLRAIIWGHDDGRVRAIWRIAVPILVGFFAFCLAGGVATGLGLNRGEMMLVSFAGATVVGLAMLALSAWYLDRRPVSEYGYTISRAWWTDLAAGFGLGILLIVITFLIARSTDSIQVTGSISITNGPSLLGLLVFFVAYVGVTFYEEFLFRGLFITNALEGLMERGASQSVAATLAVVTSTVGFTLIHLPSALAQGADVALVAAKTGLLGGLLGLGYVLTDELALPMGLHLGVNYAMMNIFGIGAADLDGVPTIFVVEQTSTGLSSAVHGIPILAATIMSYGLVIAWSYWRQDSLRIQTTNRTRRGHPDK